MSVGHDVGKDPGVAGQFLIRHARQHGDGKRDLRKGVEQLSVLDQRNAAVVQVLSLKYARLIDASVDADHQIKRQVEVSHSTRPASRRRSSTGARSSRRQLASWSLARTFCKGRVARRIRTRVRREDRAAAKSHRLWRAWRRNCSNSLPDRGSHRLRIRRHYTRCSSPVARAPPASHR